MAPSAVAHKQRRRSQSVAAAPLASWRCRYQLYTSHFLSSWGDRLWAFLVPVVLSDFFPDTLRPAAAFAMTSGLFCFLGTVHAGSLVQKPSRLAGVSIFLAIQNSTVIGCCLLLVYLHSFVPTPQYDSAGYVLAFLGLLLVGGVSAVTSVGIKLAVVKDWLVLLSRKGNGVRDDATLSSANAVMQRIDLACEISTPLAFSGLQTAMSSDVPVIWMVAGWNALSFFLEWSLLVVVYRQNGILHVCAPTSAMVHSPSEEEKKSEMSMVELQEVEARSLSSKEESLGGSDVAFSSGSVANRGTTGDKDEEAGEQEQEQQEQLLLQDQQEDSEGVPTTTTAAEAARKQSKRNCSSCRGGILKACAPISAGWRMYWNSSVLLASLSFVLLYLTALSPGVLITAYLNSTGTSIIEIAVFRGISALAGIGATFLAPCLFRRMGVVWGGLGGIWVQVSALTGVVMCFFAWGGDSTQRTYVFLAMVIVSRVGLWTFDLAETQLMQGGLEDDVRVPCNALQTSLTQLTSMGGYLAGVIFPNPQDYGYLVAGSFVVVVSACFLYTGWSLSSKSVPLRDIGKPTPDEDENENQDDDDVVEEEELAGKV